MRGAEPAERQERLRHATIQVPTPPTPPGIPPQPPPEPEVRPPVTEPPRPVLFRCLGVPIPTPPQKDRAAVPPVPHADTPLLTVDTPPANPRALLPCTGDDALSGAPL
jgi:hypothetical protein